MKDIGTKNWTNLSMTNTALGVLRCSGNKSSSSQNVDHWNVKMPNSRLARRLTDVTLLRCRNDNNSSPPIINIVVIKSISMRLKLNFKHKKSKITKQCHLIIHSNLLFLIPNKNNWYMKRVAVEKRSLQYIKRV